MPFIFFLCLARWNKLQVKKKKIKFLNQNFFKTFCILGPYDIFFSFLFIEKHFKDSIVHKVIKINIILMIIIFIISAVVANVIFVNIYMFTLSYLILSGLVVCINLDKKNLLKQLYLCFFCFVLAFVFFIAWSSNPNKNDFWI